MKYFFTFLWFTASTAAALYAQELETLFNEDQALGGFGAPIVEISQINQQTGSSIGGGGAAIFGPLYIGGYGIGGKYAQTTVDDNKYNIKMSHGGLWLGYVPAQHKVIHPYSSLRIGWGSAKLREDGNKDNVPYSDNIFVLNPEAGFEINVIEFLKISVTASYRWVDGVTDLPGLSTKDFRGFGGVITFRFGDFDGEDDDGNWGISF